MNLVAAMQVRLVASTANGQETASMWAAVEAGASLTLASTEAGEGQRIVLLEGAAAPLSLGLPDGNTQQLRMQTRSMLDGTCPD